VSLAGAAPGLYLEDIKISSGASRVQVINVIPPAVDLELAPVITATVPVVVNVLDAQNISAAYEIVGTAAATPDQIQVIGPEPIVSRIDHVEASLSVANATTSLREVRALRAVDEGGREVIGATLQPNQAQLNLRVRRRLDALDVGIQAVISGTLPADYWLSGLSVRPNSATLRGEQEALAELGSFINTLPVDISQARGDINIDVPLDLPADVQAINGNNNVLRTVNVQVSIDVRRGDLTLARPIELTRVRPGFTATVTPARVDLLLSGPLPILNEIAEKPDLISVIIDASALGPGESAELDPSVVAPEEIRVQLIPSTVLVTLSR
jgi:YbbR domain-containing protein